MTTATAATVATFAPVVTILQGDACTMLATLPAGSVHTVITSPPYYMQRVYGATAVWGGDPTCAHTWGSIIPGNNRGGSGTPTDKNNRGEDYGRAAEQGQFCLKCGAWQGELGHEPMLDLYVDHLVQVFRGVRRVLRDDGTLWLNLADSYSGSGKGRLASGLHSENAGDKQWTNHGSVDGRVQLARMRSRAGRDLPDKSLLGVPWEVAKALQHDGWVLRNECIWAKTNPMPGPWQDRFICAHEQVFLFSKQTRYFFDIDAIKEDAVSDHPSGNGYKRAYKLSVGGRGADTQWQPTKKRQPRDVWTLPAKGTSYEHYASFPLALLDRPILAGTSEYGVCARCGAPYRRIVEKIPPPVPMKRVRNRGGRDDGYTSPMQPEPRLVASATSVGWKPTCSHQASTVPATILDPFLGSGTTVIAALNHGRSCIRIELKPEYVAMARRRIQETHETASIETVTAKDSAHEIGRTDQIIASDDQQSAEVIRPPVTARELRDDQEFQRKVAQVKERLLGIPQLSSVVVADVAGVGITPLITPEPATVLDESDSVMFDPFRSAPVDFVAVERSVRAIASIDPHTPAVLDPAPDIAVQRNNAVRQNWTSKDQERLTPKKFLDTIVDFWGRIDLDPCAEAADGGQYNVPADCHYPQWIDGLKRQWFGNVFANPPYNEMRVWVQKAQDAIELHTLEDGVTPLYPWTTRVLLLCPARPGRGWWTQLRNFPVLLLTSRLKFGDGDSAPFPSALFYLHYDGPEETRRFARHFARWGDVWSRVDAP